MSKRTSSYNLTPAGYLIVRDPDEAMCSNEYRRSFGRYCGVDRLPPFYPPDPEIRELIGVAPVEDIILRNTLEDWFDAHPDKHAFINSRDEAFRLFESFQKFGFRLELIYCELAWKPTEEERLAAYSAVEGNSPVVSQDYGFDVSWPTCNHSAIFQPGVVPNNLSWRKMLNESGLLNNYSDAVRLRDEYLAAYPYPPFDIYLVHKVT